MSFHASSILRAVTRCAAAIVCAVWLVGCSNAPDTVDVTPVCLRYLPAEGTASGHVLTRTGAGSTCNFVQIELVATDLNDIFGAEIGVSYATSVAAIFLAEVGPLLTESDGVSVACGSSLAEYGVDCFVTQDFVQGTVDLEISRTPQTPGTVSAPSEGAVLATLTFSQLTFLSGANGPLEFRFGKLLTDDMPPENVIDLATDPAAFVGGTLIIQE